MDYKKKYNEAQKWIESIYSELSHEQQMEAEAFFPELKESEDERIRKLLIEAVIQVLQDQYCSNRGVSKEKVVAWLEKQGKKETLCDKCRKEHPSHSCQDITALGRCALEKQDEQKPADEVEPKFHEGEWITNGDYTWKIVEVKPLDYILQSQEGNIVDDTISHVDEQFHSFTIKEAKDGDVLACPLPKGCESGEQIFIFKGINSRDYVDNCIEYYCRICEGVFYENENGYMGTTSSPLYPATKEQRDQLEKAMADAGYIWDSKSKRLLSLKAGLNYTQNPAWSEEDEEILRTIISDGLRGAEFDMLQINWLKSLKQRIGWKPSEEQIECLYDAINHYQTNGYPASKLNELYEQMSKIYKL